MFRLATALALALVALAPTAAMAQTAPTPMTLPAPHLPRAMFPAGSTHRLYRQLTNKAYTCDWAIACDLGGSPLTHSTDADTLARTDGWAQSLEWTKTHRVTTGRRPHRVTTTIAFEFVPSDFSATQQVADMPANQAALEDFANTIQMTTGASDAQPAQVFTDADGASTYQAVDLGSVTVWFAGFWAGPTVEVEGLALCSHCTAAQRATTDAQFLAAMHRLAGR